MFEQIENLISKVLGGNATDRELKRIRPIVSEINEYAETYTNLTDDELKAKTNEFRFRLNMGETLDDILPEAFAVVKDTCRRLCGKKWMVRGQEIEWDMIPYDVQLIGGIVLHSGRIAEMATGEGKTLVASMPLYLNALEGKGAHLITVNDYLAQRDCEWMGEIFRFLGLTVAPIYGDQDPEERKQAYNADISYGTNNEFGFDYLRDNMASDIWSVVQRPLHYAIVDEVDSVLIDEARTPLIISGSVGAPKNIYYELKPIVSNLYTKQKELVTKLLAEGKELLEKDEDTAGMKILRVHRGDPKNPALLELLTSEFWVKKLIERIQGQYEVDKEMHKVDEELYYTIDEKSHVLDITEKGRIFLSGGKDQDVADKIQQLDQVDERLAKMAEQKNKNVFFTQNPTNGMCNGFSYEGKLALAGIQALSKEDYDAVEHFSNRLEQLPEKVASEQQSGKGDKSAAWRNYFNISKKADKLVNTLNQAGLDFLKSGDSVSEKMVAAFDELLKTLTSQADVDNETVSRFQQDYRRTLQNNFFESDKQLGCPIKLTEMGKIALLATAKEKDPMLVPVIINIDNLVKEATSTQKNDHTDYFDFSDNGSFISHISEKGRIALLGGNPDIYVLPDRGIVEQRDTIIQKTLDQTLNQANFNYSGRVQSIENLSSDIKGLGSYLSQNPSQTDQFYVTEKSGDNFVIKFTKLSENLFSDFADQTQIIIEKLDKAIKADGNSSSVFDKKDDQLTQLAATQLENMLGASFDSVKDKIEEWQKSHKAGSDINTIQLRLELDEFLADNFTVEPNESLSRKFEEVDRINRIFQNVFLQTNSESLSENEKNRLLRRYFEIDTKTGDTKIKGLSENGKNNLLGILADRLAIAEKLFTLTEEHSYEQDVLFKFNEEGLPVSLNATANSMLIDGLSFYSYSKEFQKFKDILLQLSSKNVNTRQEMAAALPKAKEQLRTQHIMLDDREMTELISNAYSPNFVMSAQETRHWFELYFERLPQKELEYKREKLWLDYSKVEDRVQNISQLLRAYTLYQKDVDYVVKAIEENEMRRMGSSKHGQKAVMIVDQFTGRLMPGRRFSDGLHEALEAKEGVEVQAESQTLATITLQNFFRLYNKLSGMTGTAETESQEFYSTYGMDVIVIPTNRPVIRNDNNDVIYRTREEKYNAVIDEALKMHEEGRPVLIGTVSVDVSQKLSQMFTNRGIPIANWLKKGDVTKEIESGKFHTVLNAKFHKNEAEIVAKAGVPGAITIATNMAGRGTDIKLSQDVKDRGGLAILGSEKHEARRIDRQLRGRAGRQGDPGSSRFYMSLEDDLMRLFGSDRITTIMSNMGGMEEGERIEHPLITKSIERAQKKVEERNFEIRKQLLEYDNVLNEQRKIIYKRRQNLLGFAKAEDYVASKSKRYFNEEDRENWNLAALVHDLHLFFGTKPDFDEIDLEPLKSSQINERITEWVDERLQEERHLHQIQERHRILGYVNIDSVLENLIKQKIRLHNAGTQDTNKWNVEGIISEFERVFDKTPDWLKSGALPEAAQVHKDLTTWAQQNYKDAISNNQQAYEQLMFKTVPLKDMLRIYVHAIMGIHLSLNTASVSWDTAEFLHDLERVFLAKPNLGENEIKTIRREKIVDKVFDWIDSLNISDELETQLRHRIIGYLSPLKLADAIVQYPFMRDDASANIEEKDCPPEYREFYQQTFGDSFTELIDDDELDFIQKLVQKGREVYKSIVSENMNVYNQIMVTTTLVEEMIEAASFSVTKHVVENVKPLAEAQKTLAQHFEYMYLSRPDKTIPEDSSEQAQTAFRDSMISWSLNLYKVYSDRVERFRQETLSGEIVRDSVFTMFDDTIYNMISTILGDGADLGPVELSRLEAECRLVFRQSLKLNDGNDEGRDPNMTMDEISQWAQGLYMRRVNDIGDNTIKRYERFYILEKIDEHWRQHLAAVDDLREGIGLRGYGQKDPLMEYKSEAYKMFVKMIESMNREIVSTLFKVFDVGGEMEERQMRRNEPQKFTTTHSQVEVFKQVMSGDGKETAAKQRPGESAPKQKPVMKTKTVGRNDPCPCGSGKKYKNCCGRTA